MKNHFLVLLMSEKRQFGAETGVRQNRIGMVTLQINDRGAVFQRVSQIIDNQRQNRSLILSAGEIQATT